MGERAPEIEPTDEVFRFYVPDPRPGAPADLDQLRSVTLAGYASGGAGCRPARLSAGVFAQLAGRLPTLGDRRGKQFTADLKEAKGLLDELSR
jgi:hypothetical protein